jgi:hypothetical protein
MKKSVYDKVMNKNIDSMDFDALIQMMWSRKFELQRSELYDYCLLKVFKAYNTNNRIVSPYSQLYHYAGPIIQESLIFARYCILQSLNQL